MRSAFSSVTRVILLSGALGAAACGGSSSPTDPSQGGSTAVFYAAVGASDAVGVGSSIVCAPFTACADGTGYVQRIGRRLQADGRAVTLSNLGIPGAVLAPEVQATGNSLGRDIPGNFLEREMPFVPRNTTVVTIFAGGNDANTIGAAIQAGFGGGDPQGYLNTQVQSFGRDLRTLVAGIRDRAAGVRIVILNLPNLAGLPYANGYSLARRQALQQIAVGLSLQINGLAADGVIVVDVLCDPVFYDPATYSADGFHPNDAGYAYLADLVYPAVANGTPGVVRPTCSQMTLF